jgi:diguanylate cyclase (GGDEF)-like protein
MDLAMPENPSAASGPNDQHDPRSGGVGAPRLLAVDDSALIQRLLRVRLRQERLEIRGAATAAEGLALANSFHPDVILLDIGLPDEDGFAVLEALKADTSTHDVPVIIISGEGETEAKVRGFDLGAIDFVTKPFDVAELRARVRSAVRQHRLIRMLAQRAHVDALTGLWNRAHFDECLEQELSTAMRHDRPLSLILCDLDHFKSVNDRFGHPFGDHVLEEFARLLQHRRAADIACRYGGEEFAVILPSTTADDAVAFAERVREELRERDWKAGSELIITACFGVTEHTLVENPTPALMLDIADKAMYEAKHRGRDGIVVGPSQDRQAA